MSEFVPEKQAQAKALSLLIARNVREFFKDEQHRAEFEQWYERRYGKKYVWRSISQ